MSNSIPFSLHSLASHSIFVPSPSSSYKPADEWELLEQPSVDDVPGQKNSKMVLREKDLIVAMGKEIRMMSLNAAEGSWKIENNLLGSYKTLLSSHLTFPIHQLALNPTGRLLGVAGRHQLVVLVLPKPSYSLVLKSDQIDVHSIPIDSFMFSSASKETIAKITWHPWGSQGNSLWVLTGAGRLREYDILQPHDFVQSFDFLPDCTRSARFTAVDPLSRFATSFAFGLNKVGFSPLMVYCLFANGDIYALGPIMPLQTEMPVKYLQTLKAYTDLRLIRIQREVRDVFEAGGSGLAKIRFQAEWVNSLISQIRQETFAQMTESDEQLPSKGQSALMLQRDHLSRERCVKVYPPHLTISGGPAPGTHHALLRQGPIIFSPGPQDVGNGDADLDQDQMATDLLLIEIAEKDEWDVEGGAVQPTIVAIAWSGGRVDIGLELVRPEARWISSRDSAPSQPVVHILESILLPFPNQDPFIISSNAPILAPDPLYTDVFYVSHTFGVDVISLKTIIDTLNSEDGNDEISLSEAVRLVESVSIPSTPIVGLISFCNITLGYGLVALASTSQVAYVERELRFEGVSALLPISGHLSKSTKIQLENSQSLLDRAFNIDEIISTVRENAVYDPVSALRKCVSNTVLPTNAATSDQLSALRDISTEVHSRAEVICSASQSLESRLDLQIQELERHVALLQNCRQDILALQESNILSRVEKLLQKQNDIQQKLDKIVGDIASRHQAEVGAAEKRWFEELNDLESRIKGTGFAVATGQENSESLIDKAQILHQQLVELLPLLSEIKKEKTSPLPRHAVAKIKPLQAALNARSEEIKRLNKKMEELTVKVEAISPAK
ncbi:uncharacterized protein L203_105132 [Cryptococcus depauperatus CBS 7841]|uniref:Uncharacterized protein n=1 Tax=Cryptococcus depauperatus CBS 7841 TaxID=1295531 RepID=A0A1E3HV89_9TREE|nr:hypothetical protein L203_05830 [Cryptococcus depauperatus CBS 7841]